jgi:hypothetical protein
VVTLISVFIGFTADYLNEGIILFWSVIAPLNSIECNEIMLISDKITKR